MQTPAGYDDGAEVSEWFNTNGTWCSATYVLKNQQGLHKHAGPGVPTF